MILPRFGISSGGFRIGGGALDDSLVSTACSGTVSTMASLFLRCSFSSLTTLLSSPGMSCPRSSLTLKLSRRCADMLFEGVPLVVPRSLTIWPLGSTDTNEARTLEVGRLVPSEATLPAGERPRGSGEEAAPWFSNIARKFRTPLLARSVMAATDGQSSVSVLFRGGVAERC